MIRLLIILNIFYFATAYSTHNKTEYFEQSSKKYRSNRNLDQMSNGENEINDEIQNKKLSHSHLISNSNDIIDRILNDSNYKIKSGDHFYFIVLNDTLKEKFKGPEFKIFERKLLEVIEKIKVKKHSQKAAGYNLFCINDKINFSVFTGMNAK